MKLPILILCLAMAGCAEKCIEGKIWFNHSLFSDVYVPSNSNTPCKEIK